VTTQQVFRNTLVVVATLATAYVLLLNARILIVVLIAVIIASAVRPIVLRLTRWRISEGLAITVVYAALVVLIAVVLLGVFPPIISQLSAYIENDERLANRLIGAQAWIQDVVNEQAGQTITLFSPDEIRTAVSNLVVRIQRTATDLISEASATAGEAILVFVLGVYWLTSRDRAVRFITQLFPLDARDKVDDVVIEIETSLGTYVRGVFLVCTIVGLANFVILLVLGVPNAALYGFIIGVTTALPIVGGFIGAGLAVILALLLSQPLHALAVLGTFVFVQQFETHWLTPRTMAKSVGIDPIFIIVVVVIGFTLNGVIGALLAVPVAGVIYILLRYMVIEPRKEEVTPYTVEEGGILVLKPSSFKDKPTTPPAETPPAEGQNDTPTIVTPSST
jgi:predicted PurR-regulated permease PerM